MKLSRGLLGPLVEYCGDERFVRLELVAFNRGVKCGMEVLERCWVWIGWLFGEVVSSSRYGLLMCLNIAKGSWVVCGVFWYQFGGWVWFTGRILCWRSKGGWFGLRIVGLCW